MMESRESGGVEKGDEGREMEKEDDNDEQENEWRKKMIMMSRKKNGEYKMKKGRRMKMQGCWGR